MRMTLAPRLYRLEDYKTSMAMAAHIRLAYVHSNVKGSAPCLLLVPPSITICLSLCDKLNICLPSSHSSRLAFSLFLTPDTFNCL